MRRQCGIAIGGAALLATPALAQEPTRFCPNRPSLESSACVTEVGHVQAEMSIGDWTLDRTADERNDRVLVGDFQLRLGVGPSTEVQLSWTPWIHDRTRERTAGIGGAAGAIDRSKGVGDVRLGLRQNLRNPDGKGLSFGVEPFVTLPVGRTPLGDGDWGTGVVVPVTYDLTDAVTVGLTSEVDAAVDSDGDGRHFSASAIAGGSVDLTDTLSGTLEAQLLRDNDPMGHATQAFAAAGVQWRVAPTRALFFEAVGGLNHESPDLRVYGGVSAAF